jgi:hypothetical protein
MKKLSSWAGRSQFKYTGSVKQGTSISYGKQFQYTQFVSSSQYDALLNNFQGQTVDIGTSRDNAPRGSVGEWLQSNVTKTAIASYVGPILIEEAYAEKAGGPLIKFF